jgi:hypothetical protein
MKMEVDGLTQKHDKWRVLVLVASASATSVS